MSRTFKITNIKNLDNETTLIEALSVEGKSIIITVPTRLSDNRLYVKLMLNEKYDELSSPLCVGDIL